MGAVVEVRDLNFTYPDGTLALEDVSMEVYAGEIVAIIGPNGAGKTTLLLHLNGTLRASSGVVRICGRRVEEYGVKELVRKVGLVFQDPDDQLFMPTLYEDIAFGPMNLGLDEREVRRRVEEVLSEFGLSEYRDKCPHHLSYGERKKAALAAVLAMKPEILALDEPTANLDPRSVRELVAAVKRINEEGVTVILSTHNLEILPQIADRIYLMNRTVLAEGESSKILADVSLLERAGLL